MCSHRMLGFIFIEYFSVYQLTAAADAGLEIVHCVDLVLMQIEYSFACWGDLLPICIDLHYTVAL